MQQTAKYKLNLIEPTDPFLPNALNANTQKVEDVLQAHMEAPIDALDQRVTVLEGHKIACGVYKALSNWTFDAVRIIDLGFRPKAVMTLDFSPSRTFTMMTENNIRTEHYGLSLVDNGIRLTGTANQTDHFFIALA